MKPDVYELVWRVFKNTLIYEILFRFRTDVPPTWKDYSYNDDPLFQGAISRYYSPDYNHFFFRGFPLPDHGVTPSKWGNNTRIRIFMDDLFLCPKCGAFHPISRYWPDVTWLDYLKREINCTAMFAAIEQRKSAKEFSMLSCLDTEYCKSNLEFIERKLMRDAETDKINSEWNNVVIEPRPSPLAGSEKPRTEASVYVIEGNSYVKIGIATDVKKRLASLRTSSPFPLKILKTWVCADARQKEYKLHSKFGAFRQNGEWFSLPDDILNELLATENLDTFLR